MKSQLKEVAWGGAAVAVGFVMYQALVRLGVVDGVTGLASQARGLLPRV